jgi:GT2 family glycosyltransferase
MEVFVVDNGSVDGSPEMVRVSFPGVFLIENRRNLGFAKANNEALRKAKGAYCLLLNSDTVVTSGAIPCVLRYLEENRDVGIAGLQLLNADGSRQNSIANFPTLLTELTSKSLLRRFFPSRYPGKERPFQGPADVESVIGACLFVRRAAMEQVGYLDEEYFFFLEETDWCFRMRKAGWRVVHFPGASIFHVQGGSVRNVNIPARIEYFRSRYAYFRKHHSRAAAVALHAGLFVRTAANLLIHLMVCAATLFLYPQGRNRAGVYWAILLWHLRGCPPSGGLSHG